MLSLLPLAMRMAVRGGGVARHHSEELWLHSPDRGSRSRGTRRRRQRQAVLRTLRRAGLLKQHERALGIKMVPFDRWSTCPTSTATSPRTRSRGAKTVDISGTEQRRRLQLGLELPRGSRFRRWNGVTAQRAAATSPGVHGVLHGPSGSGKSTIANVLVSKLLELGVGP